MPSSPFKSATAIGHKEKMMPVPTPPKANLLTVTKKAVQPKTPVKRNLSKSTQKLSSDIRKLAEEIKVDENTAHFIENAEIHSISLVKDPPFPGQEIKVIKKKPVFKPDDHLMTNPFAANPQMQALAKQMEKVEPAETKKRQFRRKPASKKTTGEK